MQEGKRNELMIFGGSTGEELAKGICGYLNMDMGDVAISRFSDGEIHVKINDDVRGKDVFIVQSTAPPVNENLVELLIMVDAFHRASAGRITTVIPYYGYARQDRKDQPRVPITAKLVANLLTVAGTSRVLTMDLHAGQIQGFFDIPVDHLYAAPVMMDYFKKLKLEDLVVVSPDVGGIKMARAFAKLLSASLAVVDKRRTGADQTELMNIIGETSGMNVVIVDDMISTGSSLVEAAEALKENGAKKIYAGITHPVLAGKALEYINSSSLEELVVTDTISLDDSKRKGKVKILSVAKLFGEAIKRIHNEASVSSLFV